MLVLGIAWIMASRAPTAAAANSLRAAPRVGFSAPDLRALSPSGESLSLGQWRGQVVVLNFWATWCGPCRAEMPALQSLYNAHQGDGLIVLGINQLEDAETAAGFLRALQLNFPVGLDRDGAIGARYQIRALPTTFFIDRNGVIQDVVYGGPMDAALLQSKVTALLAKP
ncbi:MAG: TlpA family protein disulfide reductase [Chloroflexi bacterium]|nr:TlpA family protein disulfide reductase [Chloroflexota bacterium]MBI3734523.1 TlpA family protein disulfide reductase [Chloroflexota bacterium]